MHNASPTSPWTTPMSTPLSPTRRLLLLGLAVAAHPALAAPDPRSLLQASDAIRNPDRPFSVVTSLLEFRNGKQVDASTLLVYSKPDSGSGQFRSLIRFTAPTRDANKLILRNGNDLWFFDPSSKASVRISPQQRLLGQASNGDVVTVNLANDYRVGGIAEELITDGDRKERQTYKLQLSALRPDVSYQKVELWVDRASNQPVKALFFSEEGSLLKTAFYRRFEKQLGLDRPTETVIIDGLNPGLVTLMRYTDYAWKDVPDEWLQREYLPRFKAQ